MKKENKHIIYTAEDIKRYITGAMPPAEMHAMEMAALDDPLLAEAMEGYELMEQKDWGKELAALKEQFIKEEEKRLAPVAKVSSLKWWRAVAATVAIGITVVAAYIFTNKNSNEQAAKIASLETDAAADSSLVIKVDSGNSFTNAGTADSNSQLIAKLDKAPPVAGATTSSPESVSVSPTPAAPVADSMFVYTPSAKDYAVNEQKNNGERAKKEYKAVAGETAASNALDDATVNQPAKARQEEAFIGERGRAAGSNQNNFSGVVVTPGNDPLSNAAITLPQSKKTIYTDPNGAFAFSSTDSAVNVTVSSVGYGSKKLFLKNSAPQNKIILQPQEGALETVSLNSGKQKGAARRATQVIDSSSLDAVPAGGWAEYHNYLNNNIQLSDEAKQKNIHGEVELTVKLKDNGDISTVKVAKPLCEECDAEAVRLVKEGPKWEVKGNKKTKAKVKVKF